MAASDGPFVGRQSELEFLSEVLASARGSGARILAIEGEPGIGKTAFVRHFLARADDVVKLEVSADETETSLELGVISQIVVGASAAGSTAAESAASLLPAPGERGRASAFAVGAQLLSALDSLESLATVLLAIDDAHWMDVWSAAALLFALRRLHADRVLVLLVSRPGGLERFGASWDRLLNDPERAARLVLGGLTAEEVRLVASSLGFGWLSRGASERLRAHTGGHPLYVRALLAELPREALAADTGPLPAPRSFAATVLTRVTRLRGGTQELLTVAAVGGPRCSLEKAIAVAGVSDSGPELEEALASGLLTLVPVRRPEEVTFSHPMVRTAIYDDIARRRRRELHRAWAQATTGSISLGHRIAGTEGSDDSLARELRAVVERELADGALIAGVDHLLAASRVAADPELREEALLKAVDCLGFAGDATRSHALREAILSCRDSARRSFTLATLAASAGRLEEAEAALVRVTERPDFSADPWLRRQVFPSLAIVYAYAGRGEDAVAWARRALAESRDELPLGKVTAQESLAFGLALSGHGSEGIAVLGGCSPRRLDPDPAEAELLATRGRLKLWHGDLLGALEDLVAVVRWSRAGIPIRSLPNAYGSMAEAEFRLGKWDDGLAHAHVAVALAQDLDQIWELPFAHAALSLLHSGRGDWELAAEEVAAARRDAERAPLPVSIYYTSVAAANLASAQEDWSGALAALSLLDQDSLNSVAVNLAERSSQTLATEALLRSGRLDDARGMLDGLPVDDDNRPLRVEVCRLRGALEGASKRPAQARAAFDQGRELASELEIPLLQAGMELECGRFLRKAGSRRGAVQALRAARDVFAALGARPMLERCDAELAACGIHSGRPEGQSGLPLNAQEQVVARLVASGKSNREVADELYLSSKAIEYHLANIFTKLGIRSRHQVGPLLSSSSESGPAKPQAVRAGP